MPFVNYILASRLTEETIARLSKQTTEIVRQHTGKDEQWLFVRVAAEQPLYFRGTRARNGGVVDVKLVGAIKAENKRKIVRGITELLARETGAPADSLYVIFTQVKGEDWGWNNDLFG